jgi:glycosyltransferase involved in cell wall biosynthesis
MVSTWHGYDRVILGMLNYRKIHGNLPFCFHIVGEGSALNYLKDLVQKCDLSNEVLFHGKKDGNELINFYDIADLGVCSLGGHRININGISSLKTREYLAKGLPCIGSDLDTQILHSKLNMYYLPFPSNESIIDMQIVYDFSLQFKGDLEIPQRIHEEAIRELSWDEQIKKIIAVI